MAKQRRVALSWSSGKDSAWSLHLLRQDPGIEVVALVTTLNEQFDRVAMHAVRRELLELQAESVGVPLWTVPLPWPCSNEQYEARMRDLCTRAISEGVAAMAFGDLFLADIRAYREKQLAGTGLEPLFPVWQIPTAAIWPPTWSPPACARKSPASIQRCWRQSSPAAISTPNF